MPMNYFRLSGACLIFISCTLAGFYFSCRIKLKLAFLNGLTDFLTRLETNIRYFSDDIFKLVLISAPSSLAQFFDGFDENKSGFSLWWDSAVEKFTKTYSLSGEEYNNLIEFGRLLGTTDTEGQLSHINIYKGIFGLIRDDFHKDCKTKSRLYKTLGFFAGATLALMLL